MLKYYKYRIPFIKPFQYTGGKLSHREGIILVYQEGEVKAFGEVAPLPGFSSENLEQIAQVLKMNKKYLEHSIQSGAGEEALKLLEQIHGFPSLSFGLDTLLHDLKAKRENKSLLQYLYPEFSGIVEANAILSIQNKKNTLAEAKKLVKQGFKTLKLKTGQKFKKDLKIIQALRAEFPHIKIRIDANQAWTKTEAIENLNSLEPLKVEYCEQPVPASSISELKKVSDSVKISIAADETVRNKQSAIEISERKAAKLIILKPMLLGTFENIFVTKKVADTHNIEVIFTTSLESAIGRAATAFITAGSGSRNFAHGLATGKLLKKDTATEKWLNKPKIEFPDSPGLGISLHLDSLKALK